MLGLQDSSTGGALPTKTYRCVACSATFPGLSSLLVHQASHANDGNSLDRLQPPPASSTQPCCSHCGVIFSSQEFLKKHHCSASSFPSSSSEEFQHLGSMPEQKGSHTERPQPHNPAVDEANALETNGSASSPPGQTNPTPSQGFSPACSSHPVPSDLHIASQPPSTVTTSNGPVMQEHLTSSPGSQPVGFTPLPTFTTPQDQSSFAGAPPVPSFLPPSDPTSSGRVLQPKELKPAKKKTLKKMLFSEFMKRLPPSQLTWRPNKGVVSSKNAVSIRASAAEGAAPSPGTSVTQLRRLLTKSGTKTKAASRASAILNVINSNKQSTNIVSRVVSLTRTFLPVVALETRQTLRGISMDGSEGQHQCGCCRRIFQDVDSLILHHVVHKKERVYGCRQCGQLLISRVPISENHICQMASMQSSQEIFSVGTVLHSPSSTQARLSQEGTVAGFKTLQGRRSTSVTKKLFHCSLCNHKYTRLYSLKTHKCQWLLSLQQANSTHKMDGFYSIERETTVGGGLKINEIQNEAVEDVASQVQKSVAVGTETPHHIKFETFEAQSVSGELFPHTQQVDAAHSELGLWSGSAKSFMPFLSKSAKHTPFRNVDSGTKGECGVSVQHHAGVLQQTVGEGKGECKTENERTLQEQQGQWTMPIDYSEVDLLIDAEEGGGDDHIESAVGDSVDSTNEQTHSQEVAFLRGGKCFICSQCGRGYTRRFTLHQHQKKCHLGIRAPMQHTVRKAIKINKHSGGKQHFDCPQCRRSFSHRDALVLHKKNCQPRNRRGDGNSSHIGTEDRSRMHVEHAQNQGRMFVLPPPPGEKSNRAGNQNQSAGGDWGIMSLPSVLPRRVTCECGAGFTCPRLLFEHLQMHTQETYICPDCGESLQSWPAFESHLRSHQLSMCPKCNRSFTLHSSLVRHLRENLCIPDSRKEKKHCCSRCNLVLPNALSLKLHMQSPPCKPSRSLLRCPVCIRAFRSIPGLQRHLSFHSKPNGFLCHICERGYRSMSALMDHRRKVHCVVREEKQSS
ncbi:zinc finger protein 814 [Megalops cyprinoides]|uniref:zinc finger protein 814 n=1 Tax=Megalops cyprinoides TaxID=118141 RepID=UPI00186441B2|nr:zinc finger protein 814 [Megalops cyprinoides]